MGDSQISGYLFEAPHNEDYSILGSILGSPYFGKLPYTHILQRVPKASPVAKVRLVEDLYGELMGAGQGICPPLQATMRLGQISKLSGVPFWGSLQ